MQNMLADDVTFAMTADTGILEHQACTLVKSIHNVYPNAELVVFIPEESMDELSDVAYSLFEQRTTIVTGDIPIPEYPISALVQAFVKAECVTDTEYIVALDTDTVIVNPITIPEASGDVFVRPVDTGAQYWCSDKSRADWDTLCQEFSEPEFKPTEYGRASVDNRRIPPYWNSGVVITSDRTLPERWLDYTKCLFYRDDLPVTSSEFFIDQISLALATRQNEVIPLTEYQNYPLGGRFTVPSDVQIIHYGDSRNLSRIVNTDIRTQLSELSAYTETSVSDLVRSYLDLVSTKSGLILSYKQKELVRNIAQSILPTSILGA